MTDSNIDARLETIEVRYAHQESALEELTRTVLDQEQQLRALAKLVKRLETQLSALQPPGEVPPEEELPPHY
ncbi:MAG TPA: SlyX protein [Gammaproteobacteria bacterium]|nr:SlyX protein [Gammaproteobacteria bacterium]